MSDRSRARRSRLPRAAAEPSSSPPDAPADAGAAFGPGDRARLAAWFGARARAFPWRRDRTPYRTWVAEIMLQQTRAATVPPYYRRFLRRFPDVASLAAADGQEVLALWEGLGYYRRARSLHAAARFVVGELDGRLPVDVEGWLRLPGVGAYTAAAIAAQTGGVRTVAIDGNVRRVGARLAARPEPRDAELHALLLPLVDPAEPGTGVEALIELGATVCTPRSPACDACPLADACRGRSAGPEAFPARRARRPAPLRRRYARVHLQGDRLWLRRRPADGLLGGMWGPPQEEVAPAGRALAPILHAYSHFRLELVPVVVAGAPPPSGEVGEADGTEARWADAAERARLPLSHVDRAVLEALAREGLLRSGA